MKKTFYVIAAIILSFLSTLIQTSKTTFIRPNLDPEIEKCLAIFCTNDSGFYSVSRNGFPFVVAESIDDYRDTTDDNQRAISLNLLIWSQLNQGDIETANNINHRSYPLGFFANGIIWLLVFLGAISALKRFRK